MKSNNIFVAKALVAFAFIFFTSCKDEVGITPDITLVTGETLNLGDVPAGSSVSETFTVQGGGLRQVIYISVANGPFTLDKELFPAANIENTGTVTISTERTTTQGAVTGTIEVSSQGILKTIALTANVVKPAPLPVDTEIYFNDMEFGLDHGSDLVASAFEGTQVVHETATVQYDVSPSGNNSNRIRVNATSSKCEDNSAGDCGNSMRFTGQGSTVNVTLSGLESDRNYEVSYWVRPGGSSDRSMDVTVTGDVETAFEDWGSGGLGGDTGIYTKRIRTGIADASGNLSINFEYSANSTSRTISVEDLRVVSK